MSQKEIRALYDKQTITVYQAFSPAIAEAAVANQTFVAPFSFTRMTWIKPSFLWMMERSGWASKANQERILSIRITHQGWESALSAAALTAPGEGQSAEEWRQEIDHAPIRVQWDPERTLRGGKAEQRSIQVGIAREWSRTYALEWVTAIADITPLVAKIAAKRKSGDWSAAQKLLPEEKVYPTPDAIKRRLGME